LAEAQRGILRAVGRRLSTVLVGVTLAIACGGKSSRTERDDDEARGGSDGVGGSGASSMGAFSNLSTFSGRVTVEANGALTNLEGLRSLGRITSLELIANPRLTDLQGLRNLVEIEGDLIILQNATLPTCQAWWLRDHIARIGGVIDIAYNDDTGVCE
jgi:hypothetical protein